MMRQADQSIQLFGVDFPSLINHDKEVEYINQDLSCDQSDINILEKLEKLCYVKKNGAKKIVTL